MNPTPIPLSERTNHMRSSAIREMLKHLQSPGIISLAGGNPAPESFPTELFPALLEATLRKFGYQSLQYSETEGFMPLRKSIALLLQRQGIPAEPERILITNGSQGALDLLAKVLLDQGTPLAVESPSYLGALQAFAPYDPAFYSLASDSEGAMPEALRQFLTEHPQGIAYLMPTFQNPTGNSAGLVRRCELAQVIESNPCLVIEDEPYSALRYSGDTQPALASLCPDRVIYLGTLSKVLAPGMRLGYCLAPEWLFPWLVKAKQGTDLHTSTFSQAIAHEYLDGGHLDRQIPKIVNLYRSRRDAMLFALDAEMPLGLHWHIPEGGMFIWIQGPAGFDAEKCLATALQEGVAYVAGNAFFVNPAQGRNLMRLNFTLPQEAQIQEGIRRLARALAKT